MVRVKICGLTRPEDVELALSEGADALGFVFEPTSPRYIGDNQEFQNCVRSLGPFTITVAVYGKLNDHDTGCMYRQFVSATIFNTRHAVIPVLRLRANMDVDKCLKIIDRIGPIPGAPVVLDAFDPVAYGGTGKAVDWGLASEITQLTDRRIILAGGLNPTNVGDAIRLVRPYAVDVSSGVEARPREKDPHKIRDFIQACRTASS